MTKATYTVRFFNGQTERYINKTFCKYMYDFVYLY